MGWCYFLYLRENTLKETQTPVVLSFYSLNKAPSELEQISVAIHKDNFKSKGLPQPVSFLHSYIG